MNRKLQTDKLTETTKGSLERAGFALVGLGAYVVDAARSKSTPDVLTDAGQALVNGFERVEHRGRSAWPRARKAADQAGDRAKRRAQDTSAQVRSSADRARRQAGETADRARKQATESADKARRQATETGEQVREQVRDALTFLRTVAESKTGIHPNYAGMTKDELYERAQDLEIDGRSEMDKDELVTALRRRDNPDFESMTKDELYELASEVDIDGRSKMSKSQLVTALNRWLADQRDAVNA